MDDDLKRHLTMVEQHNELLDCFSSDYRLPVRLVDGELSFVNRNGGTSLDGSPTFTLPEGAQPLLCWEPADTPWLPEGDIVVGHDSDTGPTHPCPHCLQVRGTIGQEAWVWIDGKLVGSTVLQESQDDEEALRSTGWA